MKKKPFAVCSLFLFFGGFISVEAQTYRMQEMLDRGLIALPAKGGGNLVSWRFLATDDEDATTFDILRDGAVIATDQYATNYQDKSGAKGASYQVVTKTDGVAIDTTEAVTAWQQPYLSVALDRPATGPNGGSYSPNDCSVGDVDGDGQYELFVKWQPDNAKDNSQSGITDNTIIDCYKIVDEPSANSRLLWRVDLGRNIRSGAHYTQFMVYDFDGDGRAEMMCKTGPGSVDGMGIYVNQAATDASIKAVSGSALYRNDAGRITGGQEWLTVFSGLTGQALHTIFYNPNRNMTYGGAADGSVNWGVGGKNDTGSYGNRGERFLAAVAHLDGPDQTASAIFCRGYYDYAFIWAVDFDGTYLHQRWFSSHKAQTSYSLTTYDSKGKGTTKSYSGFKATRGSGSGTMYQNGNHNMSVGDVDGDGCDEIVWGSAALNNDGTLLYGTGFGHGDAIHLADHCPDRPGLEVFQIHEGGNFGWDLHDAATGEIIFSATGEKDNGRGIAGAFDAKTRGSLFWSANDRQARSAVTGSVVYSSAGSMNFRVYWDGDLQDDLLDGSTIDKYSNGSTTRLATLYNLGPGSTCNGTKNTPCLQADILGDWREEVILHDGASTLAIYSTNMTTVYRMPTLMHERVYRMGICWQNTAYNQPPHVGCYLPDALAPRLLNDEKELKVEMGQAVSYESRFRYAKSALVSTSFTPDGTRLTFKLPEGFDYTTDATKKTFLLTGTPQQEGDYRIVVRLAGLGSEVVYDTITVRVSAQDAISMPSGDAEGTTAVYDAAGRVVGSRQNATAGNLYIERRQTQGNVSTRKVLRHFSR